MNVLQIAGKEYKFPAKWKEVTQESFGRIAKRFLKAVNLSQVNIIFLSAYIPRKVLRKVEAEKLQTVGEEALGFLAKYSFAQDLIPSVRLGFRNYYSLGKNLERCTLNEFAHLDYYFWTYHAKKDVAFLHKFCACLFRLKGKSFEAHDTDAKAKVFASMSGYLQTYCLQYFNDCKQNLISTYPKVFTKPENERNTKDSPPNWNGVILYICGQDISKVQTIENLPIHTALMHLQRLAEDAEKQK